MNPILILTAVEREARALARELELPALGRFAFSVFGRNALRLAPVGLGAARCEERWGDLVGGLEHPLVVSAGVCGGLDPSLRPGDLVIPEHVIGPSGEIEGVDPVHHLAATSRAGADVCTGPLVTTRKIVATPADKRALFAATGAVAVDMESALIARRAAAAGLPALVVRAVSDAADQSLPPELTRLVDPEGTLRLGRALALGVTRPAVLPDAIELGRRTRRALAAVARVLAALTT